jgi:hypothetical protein
VKVLFLLAFAAIAFTSCDPPVYKKQTKHIQDSIAIDENERAFFLIDSTKKYERGIDSVANSKK